jgi:methionyl-tRNA formyltransferase
MSNDMSLQHSPRVLFFGMEGAFSFPSLVALLESGVEVCAVIVPVSPRPGRLPPAIQRREAPRIVRSALPLVNSSLHTSIVQLAWQRQIPVWEVSRLTHPEAVSTLAAYQPDIICVSCFSLLIPASILALPRLGCLNVHPSLLPANRGPVPLFWTFREGSTTTGVTIHFMSEKMDSGEILTQEIMPIPDGISYSQLEARCAAQGGALLVQTVWNLFKGEVIPRPQNEERSYYHSFPSDDDFVVQAEEWDARHVYNFIRGVGYWDKPVELQIDEIVMYCRDVNSYSLEDNGLDDKAQYYWTEEGLRIRCKTGWVCLENGTYSQKIRKLES